jgi:hypothetical protein
MEEVLTLPPNYAEFWECHLVCDVIKNYFDFLIQTERVRGTINYPTYQANSLFHFDDRRAVGNELGKSRRCGLHDGSPGENFPAAGRLTPLPCRRPTVGAQLARYVAPASTPSTALKAKFVALAKVVELAR